MRSGPLDAFGQRFNSTILPPSSSLETNYSVSLKKFSKLGACLNFAYGMWCALLNLKQSPCIWMLWAGKEKEESHIPVLTSVCYSFRRVFFTSTLFKPKLFARNSVILKHKVVLFFSDICAFVLFKWCTKRIQVRCSWLTSMGFVLSPLCSNFSSSHFGCSSRAEKLCWCYWGQLHWQRGRGKHYLHYSRLERIYVQYLAFGTYAQVTSSLICSLLLSAFHLWVLSCKPQVFPRWCCSAAKRINCVDAANAFVFGY